MRCGRPVTIGTRLGSVEQPLDRRARPAAARAGPSASGPNSTKRVRSAEVRAPRALPIEVGVLVAGSRPPPRRGAPSPSGAGSRRRGRRARPTCACARRARRRPSRGRSAPRPAPGPLPAASGLCGGGDRLARSLRRGEQRQREGAGLGRERSVAQRHALAPREPLALGAGLALGVGEERARGAVLGRVAHRALREGEGEARVALVPRTSRPASTVCSRWVRYQRSCASSMRATTAGASGASGCCSTNCFQ